MTTKKVKTAPVIKRVGDNIFLPKKHSKRPRITNKGMKMNLYLTMKSQITCPENVTQAYDEVTLIVS